MKPTLELNETNFDRIVLQSAQPVLVDFWAPWCGPCRALAPVLDAVATERAGSAIIAKVNLEENPGLAERFQIQAIPALLYFQGGQLRAQTSGLTTQKAILGQLDALPSETCPACS